MFGRLGRLVVHHPWKVIAAWLVAAVALVAFAPKLSDITNQDTASFLPDKYESVQAADLAEKQFPQSKDQSALTIFKRADGAPLTPADEAKVREIAGRLHDATVTTAPADQQKVGDITSLAAGQVSENKKIHLMNVTIKGNAQDTKVNDAVKDLREKTKPLLQGTDLKAGYTGGPAMMLDNQDAFKKAEAIVGIVTIVLILVLLLLIYRSPVAAFLPIVVVGLVAMVAPAVIAMAGKAFDFQVEQSLQTILIVVLFGIGTDYILFLLFRYRERLRAGDDKKQAMIVAVERVGEAIASAAGAVVIAFGAMLLATLGSFRSMGPGLAIAVIVMAIAGLTLVPAVVSLLGPKVFWPSKGWQKQPEGTTFAKLGALTGRKPVAVAVVSGVIMVALASGLLGFKADYDQIGQLPSNTESAKAMKDMQSGFPAGMLNPTQVYVSSKTDQPLDHEVVDAYADSLGKADGVGAVKAVSKPDEPKRYVTYSGDGMSAEIQLVLKESPYTNAALDAIKPLRATADRTAPAGTDVVVGGATAQFTDVRTATNHDMKVIFPVAGLLIALILGLLLRSVVAPWYLMLAVVLGYASTLGATVLVFQGLADKAGVMFSLPIMIYMFVVAIGTDYNILMVARLREEAQEGHKPRKAAALAIEHAGPSIAAAGVILAGTFASLMFAGMSMMTEMGFAVSAGICISAFVMSMFLVPAVTALIGNRAWWPGHGADPRTGHGGGHGDEDREPVLAGR
ncbi:MMPL family transporter [Yinghuangia seranimata]|uniref:MMPL family transporter n=1 Tax=Yinghuangia seranimata TaxID=408067 RepID=UPI00248C90CC|nr:MMPL family transporter [Yinghuangia seranimata]MDI2130429.1 MMPL family transporter [Yinghuangia seranimata]